MNDNNENEFWSSSEEATWNNPYASSSWVDTSFTNTAEDYSETTMYEQPVVQKQTAEQVYEQITGKTENKNHVHTIICLCFIFITLLTVVVSITSAKVAKNKAAESMYHVDYEEVQVDDTFSFYDNNQVTIEDCAYTVISDKSFTGFPKEQKMIAVYVDVQSDEFEAYQMAMQNVYIGYEYEGATLYRLASNLQNIKPYVNGIGFRDEMILHTYGVANGWDEAGFYFFVVPVETEKVTLYTEQKRQRDGVDIVEKVYYKELEIVPESEEITRKLTEREAE